MNMKMELEKIKIDGVRCPKCGGEWVPRKERPKLCPFCRFRLYKTYPQEEPLKPLT